MSCGLRFALSISLLCASLGLAVVAPAAEATLEARITEEMSRVYASLLEKVGSPLVSGTREWDEAIRASVRAVLAVQPEDCSDDSYVEDLCFFRPMIVPTTAMAPTLEEGDAILIDRRDQSLRRGDIVAFQMATAGAELNIFRIVGLPGETVELRSGTVHVDGAPMRRESTEETFASIFGDRLSVFRETAPEGRTYEVALGAEGSSLPLADDAGPYEVPAGHYFVLGDNRHNSVDSRYPDRIGGSSFVSADAIIGRALIIYASRDTSRIGHRLD